MLNHFSLAWRLLLVAALVCNPVVSAAAMLAADAAMASTSSEATASPMMPCHGMPAAPDNLHGKATCHLSACCAIGALDLSMPPRAPSMFRIAQALPALEIRQADAPPPARMIRPPIT